MAKAESTIIVSNLALRRRFYHFLAKSDVIGALSVEEKIFDGSDQIGLYLSQLSPLSIRFFQTPTSRTAIDEV